MRSQLRAVFEAANSVPVRDVLASRMKLSRAGAYWEGLCPFHNDKHLGSFKVNPTKNNWRCYSCGEGGDNVEFISRFDEVSPRQAALRIAKEFNLLSGKEFTELDDDDVTKTYKRKTYYRPTDNAVRPYAHCSLVYDAFAAAAGKLSVEHEQHVHNERHIDGWEEDFFEWPNPGNGAFWRRFAEELIKRGILSSVASAVQYVPGFAFSIKTMRPFFAKYVGIGIKLHAVDGSTSGIQVRVDHPKPGASKYVLFSSSWASFNERDDAIDGACYSQIPDVLYPKNGPIKGAAVTEGRYKAIQLAKLGYMVLSLNGVNCWQMVLPDYLNAVRAYKLSDVHIYYDADMTMKIGVAKAAIALEAAIRDAGLLPYFVTWNIELGKGIDDMLFAGHRGELRMCRGSAMTRKLEAFVDAEKKKNAS